MPRFAQTHINTPAEMHPSNTPAEQPRTYLQAATSGDDGPVFKYGKWYASAQHAQMLGPPSYTDEQILLDRQLQVQQETEVMLLLFQSQNLADGDPAASHSREHASTCAFIRGLANQSFTPTQILRMSKIFAEHFDAPGQSHWFR